MHEFNSVLYWLPRVRKFSLYVGAHDIMRPSEEGRVVHLATKAIVHEKYNETTIQNDVAVIQTLSKIQFNGKIFRKKIWLALKPKSLNTHIARIFFFLLRKDLWAF